MTVLVDPQVSLCVHFCFEFYYFYLKKKIIFPYLASLTFVWVWVCVCVNSTFVLIGFKFAIA